VKIRMKADISGARNGRPWPRRGDTIDVPDGEGADLCAAGIAEPVADKGRKTETATPADDAEKREEPQEPEKKPLTTDSAPAAAKKTTARKTAAAKTATAKPQTDSK
jgi:hypothetical protein